MKLRKLAYAIFSLLVLSPFLLYLAAWLRIKYKPLPPLPPVHIEYLVRDLGSNADPMKFGYDWGYGEWNMPGRLTLRGNLQKLNEATQRAEYSVMEARRLTFARRWKLNKSSVRRVASDGCALVRPDFRAWEVRCGTQIITHSEYKILGYRWKPICEIFAQTFNRHRTMVGHAHIATACASSGGASEPHGRTLAIVSSRGAWRDLNSLIDRRSGWYLNFAVDINDSGQILCLGRQADLRTAETWPKTFRWLLLTPLH